MVRFVSCILLVALFVVMACSKAGSESSPQVLVIRPTGTRCGYEFGAERLTTLQDLSSMQGLVGRIQTSSKSLTAEQLSAGTGLTPVDTEFTESGGIYYPADMQSLFAGSLYYAVERSYLAFKSLDPKADLAALVTNFSDTRIIYNARRIESEQSRKEIHDNAEYLPVESTGTQSQRQVLNYFFAYPTEKLKDIPLGLNLGIMAHEYSHMLFQYLFYEPGDKANIKVVDTGKPTFNTLYALDEGIADYLGFYVTKDPDFFQCSFPQESRGLSVSKVFTTEIVNGLNSGGDTFDSHEGGAVWAAMQYEIGEAMGNHEVVAKSLLHFISYILTCPRTQSGSGSISLDFSDLASCHLDSLTAVGADSSRAKAIYQKYLGSYGGRL